MLLQQSFLFSLFIERREYCETGARDDIWFILSGTNEVKKVGHKRLQ